jgi:L-ascorbate metabolism protein UlaG (beta-lactamase superfamily)
MKILLFITAFSLVLQSNITTPTKEPLKVHYFYNSGWMIETPKHAIVIDFIPHKTAGITYLQQLLQKASDQNKNLLLMFTHDHNDHFDKSVVELAKQFPKIQFVFGWNYKSDVPKSMKTMINRDSIITNDYKIYSHVSTDDGVGFLLQIDGYNIYHAGDHALWADQLTQQFTDELNFIRGKTKQVDIAFVPAARGMFTKCAYDSVIAKGLELSANILKPRVIALQHLGCEDKFSVYEQAHEELKKKTGIKEWIVPAHFNQEFSVLK